MKKPIFRLSTLMILILDTAILLAIWHLMTPKYPWEQAGAIVVEFLIAIILFFFTLMIVLGFRR